MVRFVFFWGSDADSGTTAGRLVWFPTRGLVRRAEVRDLEARTVPRAWAREGVFEADRRLLELPFRARGELDFEDCIFSTMGLGFALNRDGGVAV